jgi:hypothetical protein
MMEGSRPGRWSGKRKDPFRERERGADTISSILRVLSSSPRSQPSFQTLPARWRRETKPSSHFCIVIRAAAPSEREKSGEFSDRTGTAITRTFLDQQLSFVDYLIVPWQLDGKDMPLD